MVSSEARAVELNQRESPAVALKVLSSKALWDTISQVPPYTLSRSTNWKTCPEGNLDTRVQKSQMCIPPATAVAQE